MPWRRVERVEDECPVCGEVVGRTCLGCNSPTIIRLGPATLCFGECEPGTEMLCVCGGEEGSGINRYLGDDMDGVAA